MADPLWQQLCAALARADALILPDDSPATPQLRSDGIRYLTRLFAGGTLLCVELADADYPEFGRMVDTTLSWGIDNPDCLYLYTAVRGDATYRIRGHRGSAHHFDVQVNRGHFAEAPDFGVVATLNGLDLETAGDGTIDIVLGPERHAGNWLELTSEARWVLVRQYFNDWENERPADLTIERVGALYPPPPLSAGAISARMDLLVTWFEKGARYWDEMARFSYSRGPNTMFFRGLSETSWGGLRGLAYGFGNFACAPGEAVILEVTPPPCHYWSFSLADRYWQTLDWSRRQISINGHQARLDRDGVFRAVIAHEDPGVPNWLDPAGHTTGTMMGRYLLTDAAPEPRMLRVPAPEVRRHLPQDTPVVSAAARSAALACRQRAALLRNRR